MAALRTHGSQIEGREKIACSRCEILPTGAATGLSSVLKGSLRLDQPDFAKRASPINLDRPLLRLGGAWSSDCESKIDAARNSD